MPGKEGTLPNRGSKRYQNRPRRAAANISPLSLLAGLGKGAAPKRATLRSQMAFIGGRDVKYIDQKRPTR
jgi:hypothetical protein